MYIDILEIDLILHVVKKLFGSPELTNRLTTALFLMPNDVKTPPVGSHYF